MKLDTGLGADLDSVPERARAAEAAGLDCLWASEAGNDPYLSLALATEHTRRTTVGTSIAVAFARSPMSTAYTVNQLQQFSGGRMILGLGSQVRAHIERRFSAEWSRPAIRLREYVLALRAIWAAWNDGSPLQFEGQFYRHTLMPPNFAPKPHPFGPPKVYLAAVGPRMTEVAGEVADGLITHGISSPRYFRDVTGPALLRGLARSGRRRQDIEVTCPGFIAVADSEERRARVRAGMRRHVAFYAATAAYRPVLELHGWAGVQAELNRLARQGSWKDMTGLISDEMLDTLTVIASPDTLADEIARRYGTLVDRMTVTWWKKAWWPAVGEALRAL